MRRCCACRLGAAPRAFERERSGIYSGQRCCSRTSAAATSPLAQVITRALPATGSTSSMLSCTASPRCADGSLLRGRGLSAENCGIFFNLIRAEHACTSGGGCATVRKESAWRALGHGGQNLSASSPFSLTLPTHQHDDHARRPLPSPGLVAARLSSAAGVCSPLCGHVLASENQRGELARPRRSAERCRRFVRDFRLCRGV